MNSILQQYQIAITIFKGLYSVSVLNLTIEHYQQLSDLAADVHGTALGQPVASNFFHIHAVSYPINLSSDAIFSKQLAIKFKVPCLTYIPLSYYLPY